MKSKYAYKKRKKRVGRGIGSGHGKTCCRGTKGQYSRSGSSVTPGFEGGQTTFIRRLPKRGFNNTAFRKRIEIVNVDILSSLNEKEITPSLLRERGIIKGRYDGIKVLGNGNIDKSITVYADYFSENAQKKIEAAGGKAVVVSRATDASSEAKE